MPNENQSYHLLWLVDKSCGWDSLGYNINNNNGKGYKVNNMGYNVLL